MVEDLQYLEELRKVNQTFPYTDPIKEWINQGKKVIGWVCTYVPEEVIYAAGILPVRVTGGSEELEMEEANAYLYINTCSSMRTPMELALKKEYDFLDGFVACATCDGARRLHDVWQHYLSTPFTHILTVPRKFTERAHELFKAQVLEFKRRIEEFFQVNISDEALREAIGVYNETRRLLRSLYELRKLDNPAITGAETLEILNASIRMPKDQFNILLRNLLEELKEKNRKVEGKIRLMLTGSILNNHHFIEAIEEWGGLVVVDELCTSTRYWWDSVETNKGYTPIEAISRRYVNNFPCARWSPPTERFDRVLQLAKDFRVDGSITEIVRYCVPYAHDEPLLRERLEHQGVPVLQLDLEYGAGGTGQIRTRVQAFLEMLERKKLG